MCHLLVQVVDTDVASRSDESPFSAKNSSAAPRDSIARVRVGLRLDRSSTDQLASGRIGPHLLVFRVLSFFTNEPGHPQELCLLLLVFLAGSGILATNPRRLSVAMTVAGSIAAALTLVKVNIGIFAILGVALAVSFQSPSVWYWSIARYTIGGGAFLLPKRSCGSGVLFRHYRIDHRSSGRRHANSRPAVPCPDRSWITAFPIYTHAAQEMDGAIPKRPCLAHASYL